MRTKLIILGTVLLATFALSGPASATGLKQHTARAAHRWTFSLQTTGQQIVGTTYIETDTLTRNAAAAGLALLTCTGAAQEGVAVANCEVDLGLAGGTLAGTVSIDNSTGTVRGRVTGGTGRYIGATGWVKGGPVEGGSTITTTFTSRP